jgi:hypothetical protein
MGMAATVATRATRVIVANARMATSSTKLNSQVI